MHVRDVETLEVVVEIQSPVRVHEVITRAARVVDKLTERQRLEPLPHWGDEFFERHRGRERDH